MIMFDNDSPHRIPVDLLSSACILESREMTKQTDWQTKQPSLVKELVSNILGDQKCWTAWETQGHNTNFETNFMDFQGHFFSFQEHKNINPPPTHTHTHTTKQRKTSFQNYETK